MVDSMANRTDIIDILQTVAAGSSSLGKVRCAYSPQGGILEQNSASQIFTMATSTAGYNQALTPIYRLNIGRDDDLLVRQIIDLVDSLCCSQV